MNALLKHHWGLSPGQDRVWALVAGIVPARAVARCLMVLKAYIDDSYTDGGVYVLAGYIAPAENWAAFSAEWEKLLPLTSRGKSRRRRFKMAEMSRRMDSVPAFYEVIAKHIPYSISVMLDARDVERARARIWSDTTEIVWTATSEPDVLAFVMMASALISRIGQDDRIKGLLNGQKLDVYFDNHSREDWLRDAWEGVVKDSPRKDVRTIGIGPVFADEEELLPLQAADFWAWWVRMAYEQERIERLGAGDFGVWSGPRIPGLYATVSEDQLVGMEMKFARMSGRITDNFYDAKETPRTEHALPQSMVRDRASLLRLVERRIRFLRRPRGLWRRGS